MAHIPTCCTQKKHTGIANANVFGATHNLDLVLVAFYFLLPPVCQAMLGMSFQTVLQAVDEEKRGCIFIFPCFNND